MWIQLSHFPPVEHSYFFKHLRILFPHLLNRDNKSTIFPRLLWRWMRGCTYRLAPETWKEKLLVNFSYNRLLSLLLELCDGTWFGVCRPSLFCLTEVLWTGRLLPFLQPQSLSNTQHPEYSPQRPVRRSTATHNLMSTTRNHHHFNNHAQAIRNPGSSVITWVTDRRYSRTFLWNAGEMFGTL